jgi:molecular chaperone GrpE
LLRDGTATQRTRSLLRRPRTPTRRRPILSPSLRPRRPRSSTGRFVATRHHISSDRVVLTIPSQDKCLRTVADFRNLQDRTQREVKSAREFAISAFAKDLVESVDNLDRALGTVSQEKLNATDKNEDLQDLANFHEGLKMTETILMQTLAKHGLSRVDPVGEKFNPNEHEATFMAPQPDKEDNTVFHVQQKGFKLNGRTLRAAKVGVVKNK